MAGDRPAPTPTVVQKTTTTTITSHRLELDGTQIRGLLRLAGLDVPDTATIQTAGGYCGEEVDLDVDAPLVVSWRTEEVTQR